jgi:PAS domain S-box-containing protein
VRFKLPRGPFTISWRLEIALLSVAVALGLSLLLRPWHFPYWFAFLVAGVGSAWVGGRVAGWTAVILSTLACDYFFQRPYYSLAIDPEDLPYFIVFALSMIVGNWFGTWRKNTEGAQQRKRVELETRVQVGSIELQKVSEALRSEVSSREQAEHERRLAELRWQAVFDNSVVGVVLADERGRIISTNQRYRRLIGRVEYDIIGHELADYISESHRGAFSAQLAELLGGQRQRVELEIPHRNQGGDPIWLRTHIALVAGTEDFPRFVTAFCEDISDRKQAEEALLAARSELAHASRLTTIGELTASIAHEVNQPLSAIVTNGNACLRWLTSETPKLREARDTVNWIMRDAKRASDVIARIRALTRKGEPQWDSININDLIREGLELVQTELARRKVEVSTRLDPQLPPIHGERIQLQQVFLNLALNAIEAMAVVSDRPRRLTISTAPRPGAEPGIAVEIRDSGPGVAPEDLDKLFTAFYTTKTEGTGLGLWISQSIIESHSGTLSASLNPDHGMRFSLSLPCERASAHDPGSIAGEDFHA